MKKVLIIGLGEVGSALYDIIRESNKYEVYGYDVDPNKSKNKRAEIPKVVDIVHICYPFTSKQKFVKITAEYINNFKPNLLVINSTVAPGTTKKIASKFPKILVVHSPIRGKHPKLKRHILFWTKYIGPVTKEAGEEAKKHFESLGLKVKVLDSPFETELGKIFETVYRALLIAWWQEMHRISRKLGANFKEVMDIIVDTNKVLKDRPIYFPGYIGGHCLIPNTKILLDVYDSNFLKAILKSNEKRLEELKEEEVKKEIEEIKRIALENINKEYFKGVEI